LLADGEAEECPLQLQEPEVDAIDGSPAVEPQVGGHLVVAASRGVQLAAGVAQAGGESRLNMEMDIFLGGGELELAVSDLPADLTNATEPDGQLRFRAGSIAIHVFSRGLVERMGKSDDPALSLPFHLAKKKVPSVDDNGQPLEPSQPNGIKFEMFVFDALPFAQNPVIVETAREDEFSPVKNAEGTDSPQTCRDDQLRQFTRWAKAAGKSIPADQTNLPSFAFEISPLFADSPEAFAARAAEAEIQANAVLENPS
jgi:UDP-N-acetylglucosamine pyrophosphorylase